MSKNIVDPAELIRQQIEGMSARISPGEESGEIPVIRVTQDKQFIVPPNTQKVPGPLRVVLLDFINQNQFYKKEYQKGDSDPPDCFATAFNLEDLAPNPEHVEEPVAETCAECPMAEWGSGKNGGKACKNRRKLAVVLASDDAPDDIYLLSVSPTAVKAFDKVIDELTRRQIPMCKVIMEVDFDRQADWASVRLQPVDENPKFEEHARRLPDARELLTYVPKPKEDAE